MTSRPAGVTRISWPLPTGPGNGAIAAASTPGRFDTSSSVRCACPTTCRIVTRRSNPTSTAMTFFVWNRRRWSVSRALKPSNAAQASSTTVPAVDPMTRRESSPSSLVAPISDRRLSRRTCSSRIDDVRSAGRQSEHRHEHDSQDRRRQRHIPIDLTEDVAERKARVEEAPMPERQHEPDRRAGDRQDHALGDQLHDDAPARCAMCHAHGDLLAAPAPRTRRRLATLAQAMSTTHSPEPMISTIMALIFE